MFAPSLLLRAGALLFSLRAIAAEVVISEFVASNNSTLFDGLGESSDWIELYNPTPAAVNLAGWKLRDGDSTWTFPVTALPAGGFLVVFASGKSTSDYRDPSGFSHTTFKLESGGEPLALLRPDGTIAHEYAAPVPAQREDVSYGLLQEVTALTNFDTPARVLVPGAAVDPAWRTAAAFDDSAWMAGRAAAGFNTTGAPIFNTSGIPAYRVPTGTAGNQDYTGPLGMDFVVNVPIQVNELGCFDDKGDGLGATITVQLWRRNENGTPANFGDDTGQAVVAALTFTPGAPGTLLEGSRFKALPSPITLAPGAYTIAAYGYNASERNGNLGVAAPAEVWETDSGDGRLSFVGGGRYGSSAGSFPGGLDGGPANRYAAGTFRFGGADDPTIRTDLQAAMLNQNATALMRIKFNVLNPAAYDSLLLRLPFDDGCVVWLNGTEIARRNAPEPLAHTSAATEAGNAIELLPSGNHLVAGENVLAIHGLNVAANDPDFFVGAQLSGVHTDFTSARYFAGDTAWGPNPSSGARGYVADTQFSVDRGFFEAPFEVAITSATAGATIRYTLDGSPPSATNGVTYTAPIPINTTTVLRAMATAPDLEPTNIDTHTYLFPLASAVQGSGPPPGYPSSWAGVTADYGMMSNASTYAQAAGNASFTPEQARAAVAQSLRSLPVLSIATDKANLFDPSTGIYVNPQMRGEQWERPVSAELLTANGTESFQADAGIQIMGLTSRDLNVSPKLNMRLLFKSRFGVNWLNYPFFGADGPSRVKSVALRSNTRDSWLAEYYGANTALYIANSWAHRAQAESGQPATRARYMHLFINGLYWGLYNPTERPEEHWAETVLGGEDEDYDVLNLCCGNRLDAGDYTEWQQLLAKASAGFSTTAAYQEVQGNNPDGTRNPALKKLLDVGNLIDFLINGYFTASGDWPGNFFAIYDNVQERTPGFRFPTWDNDLSFQGFNVNANKVTPPEGFSHGWWQNSPGAIDAPLRANPDYRMRMADHIYRHFFHGGAYDTPKNVARWNTLVAEIEPGLSAESARWGDYRGALRTVQNHWKPRVTSAVTTYFPQRRNAVLGQLRSVGLYPTLDAPEFNQNGGAVPSGFGLQFTAPATIYYTYSDADPRQPGGTPHPSAATATSGSTAMTLTQTGVVRARAFNGSVWSALHEATFVVGNAANAGELLITELHYHPADPTTAEFNAGYTNTEAFEFLELTNVTVEPLDLTGCHFTNGLEFTFTGSSIVLLPPGASVLIVANRDAAIARYGAAVGSAIAGEFANGTNLSDSGERLRLVDNAGQAIFDFTYSDAGSWPAGADGSGASLVLMGSDPSDPAKWRVSVGPPTPGAQLTLRDEWLRSHFSSAERNDPAISGDLADPDHDGLSNLAELCTASDPRRGDSGHDALIAAIQPMEVGGVMDRYLVLTFRRVIEPGLSVVLQSSSNLAAWSDATAQLVLHRTDDPRTGWQTLTYRSAQPLAPGASPPTFWRLRVSRP